MESKKRSRNEITSGDDEDEELKRKRKESAEASSKSRRKKKMEYEALKDENQRLKEERTEFERQAKMLEQQVENNISAEEVALKQENEMLKDALKAHKEFVDSFIGLINDGPNEIKESNVYKDGSDVAHDFLSYLLARSQLDWQPITMNTLFPVSIPVKIWIKFTDAFFEEIELESSGNSNEATDSDLFADLATFLATDDSAKDTKAITPSEASRRESRINMRVDISMPNAKYSHEDICDALWTFFKNPEMMMRMLNAEENHECIDLGKEGDDNTSLLFHRVKKELSSSEKDLGTVVLANRRPNVEFIRSTLLSPSAPSSLSEMVSTVAIASSTTSLASPEQVATDVQSIPTIIVQGAIIFNDKLDQDSETEAEAEDVTKAIILVSFPKQFRFHNLNYEQLFTEQGAIREVLGYLIQRAVIILEQQLSSKGEASAATSTAE